MMGVWDQCEYECVVRVCVPLLCVKVKAWGIMAIVVAIVVLPSAALDKHEKIGKFGFTSLGITEVRTYVHVCAEFICVVCAMILYVCIVCILHLYM